MARNLTLVAKTIQNLANMSEFGQKEAFMQPANRFIIEHRRKMQDYLMAVAVGDDGRSAGAGLARQVVTSVLFAQTNKDGKSPAPVQAPSRDLSAVTRMCITYSQDLQKAFSQGKVSPLAAHVMHASGHAPPLPRRGAWPQVGTSLPSIVEAIKKQIS
jgi:hypothetical protein